MRTSKHRSSLGSAWVGVGCALWIGYALAFIGFWVLRSPNHWAQTQGGQALSEKPKGTYNTEFNPSHQKPVSVESRDLIISLKRTEPCSTCPAQRAFLFEVKRRGKGTASEFRIANHTAQIDQAYIVNAGRAAIVGRIQSSTSIVNLVDLKAGKLLDEFWCFEPSVSPSGRFVAYAKVFPLHFVPGVSYEYLVYDLSVTPEENRTPQNRGRTADRYDVGWAVYPEGLLNTPGDNILTDQSLAHFMSSDGFFWLDKPNTLAFVDRWQGVNRLVVADVSAGIQRPRVNVYPIDQSKLVDLPGCKSKVAPSDFEAWSKDPSTLIDVTDIVISPENAHALRLHFRQQPCLATTVLDISLRATASRNVSLRVEPSAQ